MGAKMKNEFSRAQARDQMTSAIEDTVQPGRDFTMGKRDIEKMEKFYGSLLGHGDVIHGPLAAFFENTFKGYNDSWQMHTISEIWKK